MKTKSKSHAGGKQERALGYAPWSHGVLLFLHFHHMVRLDDVSAAATCCLDYHPYSSRYFHLPGLSLLSRDSQLPGREYRVRRQRLVDTTRRRRLLDGKEEASDNDPRRAVPIHAVRHVHFLRCRRGEQGRLLQASRAKRMRICVGHVSKGFLQHQDSL